MTHHKITVTTGCVLFILNSALMAQSLPDILWSKQGTSDPPTKDFAICQTQDLVVLTSGTLVTVRRLSSGDLVSRFPGNLSHIAISRDGAYVVGVGPGISLYDVSTGTLLWNKLKQAYSSEVAFSSDHSWLVAAAPYATKYSIGGEALITYEGLEHPAISPDDTLVAGVTNRDIRIVDSASGDIVRSIDTNTIGPIAFSPNGTEIAAATGDHVTIWRISDGSVVAELESGHVYSLSYSADGRIIFAGRSFFEDGKVIATTPLVFGKFVGSGHECLFRTPGAELIGYNSAGDCTGVFPAFAGMVISASRDVNRFIVNDRAIGHGATMVMDLLNPSIKYALGTFHAIGSFFQNGERIAVTGDYGLSTRILVFDSGSGQQLGNSFPADGQLDAIAPAGVASILYHYWDYVLDRTDWHFASLDINTFTFYYHLSGIYAGSADFRGSTAMSDSGSYSGVWITEPFRFTRIYKNSDSTLMFELPTPAQSVLFSPDDEMVVIDDKVRRVADGGVLFDIAGVAFTFSPDSRHLLAYDNLELHSYDTASGQLTHSLEQGIDFVDGAVWVDGLVVYSGFEDGIPFSRAVFDPFTVQHATPTKMTVARSNLISGDVSQLVESDNDWLKLKSARLTDSDSQSARITVEGSTTAKAISILQVKLEGAASIAQIRQNIDLYDYVAAEWVTMNSQVIGTTDGVVNVNVGIETARFLQGGHLRGRITYRREGVRSRMPWSVRIDQVSWTMSP